MRYVRLLACGLLLLGGALSVDGCSSDSSYTSGPYGTNPTPSVPPNTVQMSGMAFGPTTLTVSAGTTVTWKNNDGVDHTSTSDTGVWNTGNIAAGGTATTTFNTAGSFPYHCSYHPGMKGTVVVQ